MELIIVGFAFMTTALIFFLSFKNRNKRARKNNVVTFILLANSSVLMALVLNSMYSLLFFALHIIFLILALVSAIKAAKHTEAN